jgi:hypothetical protein
MTTETLALSPEESWLTDLAQGAVTGATTGAVAGPWGALIGAVAGAGLSAVQSAVSSGQQPAAPAPPRPAPAAAPQPPRPAPAAAPPSPAPAPAPARPATPALVAAVGRATIPPARAAANPDTLSLERLLPAILSLAQALSAQALTAQALAQAPEGSEGAEAAPLLTESVIGEADLAGPPPPADPLPPTKRTRYAEAFESLEPFVPAAWGEGALTAGPGEAMWATDSIDSAWTEDDESAWIAKDDPTETAFSEWID